MNLQSNVTKPKSDDVEHRGLRLLQVMGFLDQLNDCNHVHNHGDPNKCLQCQALISEAMYHLLHLSTATRDGKLFFAQKR